jgi:putative transposase
MGELKSGLARYFAFHNDERFHESLGYETPTTIYAGKFTEHRLEKAA